MKYMLALAILSNLITITVPAQEDDAASRQAKAHPMEILMTESHIQHLDIALSHTPPNVLSNDCPVLFLHGASFPSALAFGFKMNGYSWMDQLAENGYDVYALDFPGYGNSGRYPGMQAESRIGKPVGRNDEVCLDVDKAVNFILQRTGQRQVYLIGHSWGGSIAALYATKFPDKVAKLVLFAAITPRADTSKAEQVDRVYETLTPAQRIAQLKGLTPAGKECQLEPELFQSWGKEWLHSDPLASSLHSDSVRYPAGPGQDIEDMLHNKPYYNPSAIKTPTLLIRGEWDKYPDNKDAEKLFQSMGNVSYKKYVVIEKGTHVLHLEKSRVHLYDEVLHFLQYGRNNQNTNKHAIAVIFEVIPAEGHKQEYLDIAASLRPLLDSIKGFISIERFQSIYHPEKILSLSFWESESAIRQWRNLEQHRLAQSAGREHVFKDYHLRIAQVIRDYGMFERQEAPADSRSYHGKK